MEFVIKFQTRGNAIHVAGIQMASNLRELFEIMARYSLPREDCAIRRWANDAKDGDIFIRESYRITAKEGNMKVKEPWYQRCERKFAFELVAARNSNGAGTMGWKGTFFDGEKESALYGDYISLSDIDADYEETAELLARQAVRVLIAARKDDEGGGAF